MADGINYYVILISFQIIVTKEDMKRKLQPDQESNE